MRTTKLVLYNRYTKTAEGKTVKKTAEKFPRAICLNNVLKEKKYKDFDSFIIASDKLYCEKNEGKESNIPETFRIWRIVSPVLVANGIEVPEYLQ